MLQTFNQFFLLKCPKCSLFKKQKEKQTEKSKNKNKKCGGSLRFIYYSNSTVDIS
jgi:hypothetical protein